MRRHSLRQSLLLGVALAAAAAGTGSPAAHFRLAVWPPQAGTPAFSLNDAQGAPRTLADYRGHIVVMYFGFLRCPDACPAGLHKLAQVTKQLGPGARHVRVLFVTLDPERDTPALLARYVSGFDPHFIGLTGTNAQVDQAASSFHVPYARVPAGSDYTINHSTATLILDRAGRLRLIGAADAPVADFVHDIRALMLERQ
jgi:protein SCO1/2